MNTTEPKDSNTPQTVKEWVDKVYPQLFNDLIRGSGVNISDTDIIIYLVNHGVPKEQVKAVTEEIIKQMAETQKITPPDGSKHQKNKYSRKSKMAPISSISSIILGGIIALIATFSFIIDVLTTQNLPAIAIDLIVMSLSYLTVWQGFYYTIVERIARERMQAEYEYKIEPIVNLLTETITGVKGLREDVVSTNAKVSTTLDYFMKSQDMDASKAYILPGLSFKFISKINTLIFITFAGLVYISAYPLGTVHYFIMMLYIMWWLFITAEYKQFGSTAAWIWGIAPVLIIPSVGILMSAIYGLNIMIGILFIALAIYVYSYYTWACYVQTGYKLIDLKPVIYQIRNRFEKPPEQKIDGDELKKLIK